MLTVVETTERGVRVKQNVSSADVLLGEGSMRSSSGISILISKMYV